MISKLSLFLLLGSFYLVMSAQNELSSTRINDAISSTVKSAVRSLYDYQGKYYKYGKYDGYEKYYKKYYEYRPYYRSYGYKKYKDYGNYDDSYNYEYKPYKYDYKKYNYDYISYRKYSDSYEY